MKKSIEFYCWIFVIGVIFILNISMLISDGMFMDAEQYTGIAHNLALGKGTFWFPYQSKLSLITWKTFHEQPPLLFYLQSLFFKMFGDSIYVERFYMFCNYIFICVLIYFFWMQLAKKQIVNKQNLFLPYFLWIIIPTAFWGFNNNAHENGMSFFTTSSVLLSFIIIEKKINNIAFIVPAILIVLATLSKGVPGFYPLAVPFVYWLIFKNTSFKNIFFQTFLMVATISIIYGIILLNNEAKTSLHIYFFERLLARIHSDPIVSNRFQIIEFLLLDLAGLIGLFLILKYIFKLNFDFTAERKKYFILFITIGLCAVLPMTLTKVQRAFYNIPAFPMFAIAFAILFNAPMNYFKNKISNSNFGFTFFKVLSFAILIFGICLTYNNIGTTKCDNDTLKDVRIIAKNLNQWQDVSVRNNLFDDWSLQCYLIRLNNISLDCIDTNLNYFLILNNDRKPNNNYTEMNIGLEKYKLFKKNK